MPNSRYSPLQLVLGPAVLLTLMPSGCAVGVAPEFEDSELAPGGSGNGGGASGPGGSGAGMPSPPSNGGTTSVSGSGNAFGGSAGSGGKGSSGSGSGGASGGAGSAGSAGSSGASTGGSGGASGGCGCSKTLAWMDNANLSWTTGDCLTTGGVTYRYVGTKAQTYANGDCNPAKQLPWCSDSGNDYKFMACP